MLRIETGTPSRWRRGTTEATCLRVSHDRLREGDRMTTLVFLTVCFTAGLGAGILLGAWA